MVIAICPLGASCPLRNSKRCLAATLFVEIAGHKVTTSDVAAAPSGCGTSSSQPGRKAGIASQSVIVSSLGAGGRCDQFSPRPIPVPTHPVGDMWRNVRNVPRAATLHDLKAMLDEMRTERDAFGASRRNASPCPSHRSPPGGGGGGYVETRSQRRHRVIIIRSM